MRSKSVLTVAVLSAALLPTSGAFAQDNQGGNAGAMAGSTMEVGQFRESLTDVRGIFEEMRENSRLALAAGNDPMVSGQLQNDNRRLLNRAMGLLTRINANWKRNTPAMAMSGSNNRFGSATMNRYANESSDTAFVRNTVWELQNMLQAAKLNGRVVVITDEMMEMLSAAITRSENPDFRVAQAWSSNRLSRIEWRKLEEAPARSTAAAETTETRRITVPDVRLEHDVQYTQRAETTTEAVETTSEERMGAATEGELPQTGGNPGLIMMLGTGLMGLGAVLRRRR